MRVSTYLSEKQLYGMLKRMLVFAVLFPIFLTSCDEQRIQVMKWTEYEPVYMTEEEFKNAVEVEGQRDIEKPGKIYIYKNYLMLNEINKGIHLIDNEDPSNPVIIGFINIPANKDLAVREDFLYADSHSDLLVFDISDIQSPTLLERKEGVFEFSATKERGFPYQEIDPSNGLVVDWEPVTVEEVCEHECGGSGRGFPESDRFFGTSTASFAGGGTASGGAAITGTGGSMARFTITGDFLYAVDERNLLSFNINSQEPVLTNTQDVGWNIETIFPYQNYLYVGSESAMYIYDITNSESPNKLSAYPHFTACDPVVVQNDIAYVTLRTGQRCPRGVNRLEVIDVEDPENPSEIAFYEMKNPHGLGIDGNHLFISEGENGIKIMDAQNPRDIKLLRHITDIETFDVIPINNVLMITGNSGIVQYDYSDINNIKHLSTIPVVEQKGS